MIQLDSGVLTRLAQKDHRDHAVAASCILVLHAQGETLGLLPQNIYEFWTVATRPRTAAEGLGLTPVQAKAQVERFVAMFTLQFTDDRGLYQQWSKLAETHSCSGKAAHDARIIAAMNLLGLSHLLTFNPRDFQRYTPAITLLNPHQVAASGSPSPPGAP
jgi:predicted nucleic acid-binding protein